jgi:hypothetical protein
MLCIGSAHAYNQARIARDRNRSVAGPNGRVSQMKTTEQKPVADDS